MAIPEMKNILRSETRPVMQSFWELIYKSPIFSMVKVTEIKITTPQHTRKGSSA